MLCGTTFVDERIRCPSIRSIGNANTFPAFNAGIRSGYRAKTPFTFPSVVHLPRRFLPGSQHPRLSVSALDGLISASTVYAKIIPYFLFCVKRRTVLRLFFVRREAGEFHGIHLQ